MVEPKEILASLSQHYNDSLTDINNDLNMRMSWKNISAVSFVSYVNYLYLAITHFHVLARVRR